MLEQPKAGLISRFYRQVENRLKNGNTMLEKLTYKLNLLGKLLTLVYYKSIAFAKISIPNKLTY